MSIEAPAPKKRSLLFKLFVAFVAIIVIFVIVVATRPNDFSITRSATISAPPQTVFEQVNDFHKWGEWSPWEKIDPNLKRTYEGPASGKGASYAWVGNNDVGEGKMTITESKAGELIQIHLEFIKPFPGINPTEFTFKPQGEKNDKTLVTWTMRGEYNFISKAICLFMSMDKMVGGMFEQGLDKMKTVSEAQAKK